MKNVKTAIDRFYAFLDRPIHYWVRGLVLLTCVPLALSLTQPLWRISMEAPQYPGGLWLDIWSHGLAGGNEGQHLKEINNLNHYIGMQAIDERELTELGFMPFAIGVLGLLALRVAALGNVRALLDLTVLSLYTLGFFAARFAYRLYVYGHHLDPTAAFTVEPFTPALIGTKQIANFTTHSLPRMGTYLLGAYALGLGLLLIAQLAHGFFAARRRAREEAIAPPRAHGAGPALGQG